MRKKYSKRLWALALSAALLMTQLPAVAAVEVIGAKNIGASTTDPNGRDGGPEVAGVTNWTFVGNEGGLALPGVSMDNQADFDTVVSLLPTQISAEIEGEAEPATIDITGWSCPEYVQDGEGNWPPDGEYTFTAALPEGYACAPPPSVLVTLGGVSVLTINDRHTVDGLVYQETGPRTVQILRPEKYDFTGVLRVPAQITSQGRTYAVTGIGNYAFQSRGITELDLSQADSLTRIGDSAFAFCPSLGTVRIPAGVTDIGDSAFERSGITSLDLSGAASLTRIGSRAFSRCAGLTETVRIPAGVTDIGDSAFRESGITDLDFSGAAGLTRINWYAFSQCDSLTGTVTIPAGVTDIGDYAFSQSGITGLDLSGAAGLTRINRYAFSQCDGLTGTVTIPDTVKDIGDSAFQYSKITSLDLSGANSLTRIGWNVFWSCADLTGTVTIPSTVTEIGRDAFGNVSDSARFSAADNAVAALLKASGVDESKITLSGGGALVFPPVVEFTEGKLEYRVTGADTVTVIGFKYGESGSLEIPAQVSHGVQTYQVTEIGSYAFQNETVTGLDLSQAASLTRIDQGAFIACESLTGTVRIPASVTEIGANAFVNSGITGLDLSGAVTLRHIGEGSFFECRSLTGTVTIPAAVTEIGENAFVRSGITGLDLSGAASLTHIGSGAFLSCSSLTGTVDIPAAVTKIGKEAFDLTGIDGLNLSGAVSLRDIGSSAFHGCRGLTGRVDIPAAVTQIGEEAFNSTGITEVFIRGRLQSMGASAFPSETRIHCSDPHTQLLVNEMLQNKEIPTASWDGQSDLPPGAIVTVDRDITISQGVTIGEGAEIVIGDGMTVTVGNGGAVTMEPETVITVQPGGTLATDQGTSLSGSGTIALESGGTLSGTPGSGITVAYLVTVVNGSGGGAFPAGAQVSVTANSAPAGQVFDRWTSQDGVSFDHAGSMNATFTMPAKAVTVTATYRSAGGSSGGGSGPSFTDKAVSAIKKATDGDTVKLDLPAGGRLSGKVLEAAAGKDITLEISAGKGAAWIIKGRDIPTGKLSDLNLKVETNAGTIPVTVLNALTGEQMIMQLTLSHSGPFPFPLTLRLETGRENAGLFANLYYYDEAEKMLNYQSAAKISPDGTADIPFAHASSYAVIIDAASHAPVTWENPFADVAEDDWFYGAVAYVSGAGLMSGTSEAAFSPDVTMNRAMLWTVLARLDGQETEGGATWYEKGRDWAMAAGVSDGTDPEGPVTREQVAAMLYRYAVAKGADVSGRADLSKFSDASSVSTWATAALSWANAGGIVTGKPGDLDPQGKATRAEVAAMLKRYLEGA